MIYWYQLKKRFQLIKVFVGQIIIKNIQFSIFYLNICRCKCIKSLKSVILFFKIAASPLEASCGTLKTIRYLSMLLSSLYDNFQCCVYDFFCNFSWDGGGTLPQKSCKHSKDLCEATLYRWIISVQRLARSFGTNIETHRQIDILLL